MSNFKLRPASGRAKKVAAMLQMKPSELAKKYKYVPRCVWKIMSSGQRAIFIASKPKSNFKLN